MNKRIKRTIITVLVAGLTSNAFGMQGMNALRRGVMSLGLTGKQAVSGQAFVNSIAAATQKGFSTNLTNNNLTKTGETALVPASSSSVKEVSIQQPAPLVNAVKQTSLVLITPKTSLLTPEQVEIAKRLSSNMSSFSERSKFKQAGQEQEQALVKQEQEKTVKAVLEHFKGSNLLASVVNNSRAAVENAQAIAPRACPLTKNKISHRMGKNQKAAYVVKITHPYLQHFALQMQEVFLAQQTNESNALAVVTQKAAPEITKVINNKCMELAIVNPNAFTPAYAQRVIQAELIPLTELCAVKPVCALEAGDVEGQIVPSSKALPASKENMIDLKQAIAHVIELCKQAMQETEQQIILALESGQITQEQADSAIITVDTGSLAQVIDRSSARTVKTAQIDVSVLLAYLQAAQKELNQMGGDFFVTREKFMEFAQKALTVSCVNTQANTSALVVGHQAVQMIENALVPVQASQEIAPLNTRETVTVVRNENNSQLAMVELQPAELMRKEVAVGELVQPAELVVTQEVPKIDAGVVEAEMVNNCLESPQTSLIVRQAYEQCPLNQPEQPRQQSEQQAPRGESKRSFWQRVRDYVTPFLMLPSLISEPEASTKESEKQTEPEVQEPAQQQEVASTMIVPMTVPRIKPIKLPKRPYDNSEYDIAGDDEQDYVQNDESIHNQQNQERDDVMRNQQSDQTSSEQADTSASAPLHKQARTRQSNAMPTRNNHGARETRNHASSYGRPARRSSYARNIPHNSNDTMAPSYYRPAQNQATSPMASNAYSQPSSGNFVPSYAPTANNYQPASYASDYGVPMNAFPMPWGDMSEEQLPTYNDEAPITPRAENKVQQDTEKQIMNDEAQDPIIDGDDERGEYASREPQRTMGNGDVRKYSKRVALDREDEESTSRALPTVWIAVAFSVFAILGVAIVSRFSFAAVKP